MNIFMFMTCKSKESHLQANKSLHFANLKLCIFCAIMETKKTERAIIRCRTRE